MPLAGCVICWGTQSPGYRGPTTAAACISPCTYFPGPHTYSLKYTHPKDQNGQDVEHNDDRSDNKYEVGQLRGRQTSACAQKPHPARSGHCRAHLCIGVHSISVEVEDAVQQQRCGQYHDLCNIDARAARLCNCSSRRRFVSCCRQRRQECDSERPPGLCTRSLAGRLRSLRPHRKVRTRCRERRAVRATAALLVEAAFHGAACQAGCK